jgi:hypothetical protein
MRTPPRSFQVRCPLSTGVARVHRADHRNSIAGHLDIAVDVISVVFAAARASRTRGSAFGGRPTPSSDQRVSVPVLTKWMH